MLIWFTNSWWKWEKSLVTWKALCRHAASFVMFIYKMALQKLYFQAAGSRRRKVIGRRTHGLPGGVSGASHWPIRSLSAATPGNNYYHAWGPWISIKTYYRRITAISQLTFGLQTKFFQLFFTRSVIVFRCQWNWIDKQTKL